MKISILIPTHDTHPSLFTYDLAQLYAHTVASLPQDAEVGLLMVSGTYIHVARQELLEAALADGADYVLWVDADMRFPRDAFMRLRQRARPFIGINYARREVPSSFTAMDLDGNLLVTEEGADGVEEVAAFGFGMVLMDCEALRKALADQEGPWFRFEHSGDGLCNGEDVYFCNLLRDAGAALYVDHGLSNECGHVGPFTFLPTHGRMVAQMKADMAAQAEEVEA